jgi:hypothetical protein
MEEQLADLQRKLAEAEARAAEEQRLREEEQQRRAAAEADAEQSFFLSLLCTAMDTIKYSNILLKRS